MGNWRPKDWENHYSELFRKKHLPFAMRGQEADTIDWSIEDCEIAFEAGADALLGALTSNAIVLNPLRGIAYDISVTLMPKDASGSEEQGHIQWHNERGWVVFIPSDNE